MNNQEQTGTNSGLSQRGRARTRADLVKRWQVVTIFAIGRNLQANVERLCADLYLCRPSELSRVAADEMIGRLKQMRPARA